MYGHRRVFRCTAVDGFSGTLPSANFQVHGLLSRYYDHMALTVGQWSCSAAPDLGNPAQARSVEHRVPGVADVYAIRPIFSVQFMFNE